MVIKEWQDLVDQWIKDVGVRYFDMKTNTILLMEEVGELSRLVARMYGEQSFKKPLTRVEQEKKFKEELGDIFFVLTCIANQIGADLTQVLEENLKKKTNRDQQRHQDNPKLRNPLL